MTKSEDRGGRVLVVYDGSAACVACCAIAPDPRRVVLWMPPGGSGHPIEQTRSAMTHQARLMDLGDVCDADGGAAWREHPGPLGETRMLLLAMERGAELGCGRVVWPVVCGPDLDGMAAAAETAELVTRLGWIAFPGGSPRIETPLADLTPEQVAELLEDLRVPAELLGAPAGA